MTTDRPTTLNEVAQLAGVSLTTASKAMNGQARISETTRKRVLQAARQLSYTPNLMAKSLASGRGSIVGVLLRDSLVHRLAMPIVIGAQSELEQRDFSAIIADATGETSRLSELGSMLRRRGVDGLLVIGDNQGATPSISDTVDIPCVYVHGTTTDRRDVVHVSDDCSGATTIVEHLLALGRTNLAHITGPEHTLAVHYRYHALLETLERHGRTLITPPRFGTWSQHSARQATREILAETPDVDAIVCGSDQLAVAALEVVLASGRSVPDDVAITGYDNWTVFAQETDPGLTTVDMELAHLGAAAVKDLFILVDGGRPGGGLRLHDTTLIIRGSTDRSQP